MAVVTSISGLRDAIASGLPRRHADVAAAAPAVLPSDYVSDPLFWRFVGPVLTG